MLQLLSAEVHMVSMRFGVLLMAGLLACSGVLAQQPSLDALQEKLNKAKREAQQLEEATREKRRQADAEKARKLESERARERDAALARELKAEQARERESEAERARDRERAAERAREYDAERAREREAEQAREREAEQARDRELIGRFTEEGDIVRDTRTGLLWSQSDNGTEINWSDASRYCSGKGGGWRLPTISELQGIYRTGGSNKTQCGRFRCDVSALFRLTDVWFMSSEKLGNKFSSRAVHGVTLDDGRTSSYDPASAYSPGVRALCVRRP
jgi:hypothetical protein